MLQTHVIVSQSAVTVLLMFLDAFPSAPHKSEQLQTEREESISARQVPLQVARKKWRHAKRIVDFRTEREAETVSLSLLATMPQLENTNMSKQSWETRNKQRKPKNRRKRNPRQGPREPIREERTFRKTEGMDPISRRKKKRKG